MAVQAAGGVLLPVRDEGVLQVNLEELKTQLDSQTSAKEYGTLLGQVLFRDDIRDAFKTALAKQDDSLHVLLFVEDAELKALRWERLCAPLDGGWDFLALNQRVPFSLHLPSTTDQRFPPIGRFDLRALMLCSLVYSREPRAFLMRSQSVRRPTKPVGSVATCLGTRSTWLTLSQVPEN